ncbi:MAG TPA: LysM peptidoglycan-binding domain-containing protein [Bacillota bacterium]|nr:LysM peptidoglycan-binding domain-containing protein [Bacillota bacterium]
MENEEVKPIMEETTGFRMECVVQAGDNIEAIALAFNTTPEDLQKENPQVDVYHLLPEQVLQFPFPMRCSGQIYIARQGDTLARITRQFRVSEEDILRENPFLRILGIRPGFPICIPAPQPPVCRNGFLYTIVSGDTLFSLALRFNTTVDAILRANPGLNPNQLYVGQQICIPGRPTPACPGTIYTVVTGDTLTSIAVRFNTSVQAIIQANPGINPNFIVPGQQICIPTTPTPRCPGFIYTVVAGDTLFSIANRFNTTINTILQVNPGLNPNLLYIGQQICIPQ